VGISAPLLPNNFEDLGPPRKKKECWGSSNLAVSSEIREERENEAWIVEERLSLYTYNPFLFDTIRTIRNKIHLSRTISTCV
jgi:hypothetical protein